MCIAATSILCLPTGMQDCQMWPIRKITRSAPLIHPSIQAVIIRRDGRDGCAVTGVMACCLDLVWCSQHIVIPSLPPSPRRSIPLYECQFPVVVVKARVFVVFSLFHLVRNYACTLSISGVSLCVCVCVRVRVCACVCVCVYCSVSNSSEWP